ncbi:MAG: PAS domain-containing protein [Phycisphaera sp.]|nr:MAG: PAS domain-containing protein [Phycisphaera sp.]
MPSDASTWESVAIVGALSSFATGLIVVLLVQIRKLQAQTAQQFENTRQHMDVQTVKMNGIPNAQLDNLEFPTWAKGIGGRMKMLSPAYTAHFGKTPHEYVGKDDHQVWPKDVADKFVEHDTLVVRSGAALRCLELVPSDPRDPTSERKAWVVVKYPIRNESREIVGVGGYAIPEEVITTTQALLESTIPIEEVRGTPPEEPKK